MRGSLFGTAGALGLALSAVAFAHPGTDPVQADAATAAEETAAAEAPKVDCATLEGEAKTTCEAAEAAKPEAAEAVEAAAKPDATVKKEGKGGKAQRSNTNRMERIEDDE